MPGKSTIEKFIKSANLIHGNRYDYSLVVYKNNSTKINIKCKVHGIYSQRPNSHLMGQGCPSCGKSKKKTTREFIIEAKLIHGDKYDYSLVVYKNTHKKIDVLCIKHGIFTPTPKNHINGSGCPKCANNINYNTEDFIERAKLIHGEKYDYSLTEYEKSSKKIKIICPKHSVFKQTANSHLQGSGCKKCNLESKLGKFTSNSDKFINKAKKIHKNKYDYSLVEYKGVYEHIKIICPKHSIFEQKPYVHLNGSGCQKCKESKGERIIRNFLLNKKINFISQKKFDDCLNKRKLVFDFYLPEYNICLEFDGSQHFKTSEFFGGENAFNIRKKNDIIKNEYCELKNIKLIRIPYFENDIIKKLNDGIYE